MKEKTARQPKWNAIAPMTGPNRAVAKYCAELKIAEAVPRSLAGNQAATSRALPGNDGDSAAPTRRRRMNRTYTAAAVPNTPGPPWSRVNKDQARMRAK